jgi:hypothetical protein
MLNPHDIDPDDLIAWIGRPLAPADRERFRRAAAEALERVPCWGEGAAHRALAELQRAFFDPPDFSRANGVSKYR